jgi:polysaccharide chain length determinant protein (PEP-CTERM system associated)
MVGILVRRRWLILLPFALGLAAAPFMAVRVPKVYRSETVMMVIPQRVPDSYVRSTVTQTVQDRLPSITDQILSRTRLERVILDFDLYKELRARTAMEDVVARMRRDIGQPQIQRGQQSFRVSYVSPDPRTAQKVTARLAMLFIEENSRDRENLADSTNVFLESQLEEAKQRLLEHERKVEAFKLRYSGELPSQMPSNLQALTAAQNQLQGLTVAQNSARDRRHFFERQLAEAQATEIVTAPNATTLGIAPTASATERLLAVEAQIAFLKQKYTSEVPELRALERTARELRPLAEEERQRPLSSTPVAISPAEQARQKRISELKAEIEMIDRQLVNGETEEARLKALVTQYSERVAAIPTRESQLVELTRDYDVQKRFYDGLLGKREDSKLAANLERRQIGEQFRILDPASFPAKPADQMQRLAFTFAGAIAGLAVGLGLAVLLHIRDSSFRTGDEVQRVLELPVLALVPHMSSRSEQRSRRRNAWIVDIVAGATVLGSVAAVAVWGLRNFYD